MTSSSAVIAKLMTMAVSTSACGSGSAYSTSEATRLPSMIGDLLTATRPVTKMKTFTA
jgi:outer membrane lipoprotein SlyB